ncbi:MAG: hypothetical protein GY756_00005, partial [bacterium]|nr:hypothetical protein [bacterium]
MEIYVQNDDPEIKYKQYQRLRDISYYCYQCANKISSDLYANLKFKERLKEQDKELPEIKAILNSIYENEGHSGQNIAYKISGEFKKILPSYVRSALAQTISKQFKSDIKEILRGDRSLRNYRRDGFPIYFNMPKDRKWFFSAGDGVIDFLWFEQIKFRFNFGRDRSNNMEIIKRIM